MLQAGDRNAWMAGAGRTGHVSSTCGAERHAGAGPRPRPRAPSSSPPKTTYKYGRPRTRSCMTAPVPRARFPSDYDLIELIPLNRRNFPSTCTLLGSMFAVGSLLHLKRDSGKTAQDPPFLEVFLPKLLFFHSLFAMRRFLHVGVLPAGGNVSIRSYTAAVHKASDHVPPCCEPSENAVEFSGLACHLHCAVAPSVT